MLGDDAMRGHLEAFLARNERTVDELMSEIDPSFGTPLLAVASGSVLHGFGNPSSDVDLHLVVDDSRVTDFPVSSHTLGVTVDVNYVRSGELRRAAEEITGDWRAGVLDRDGWRHGRRRLTQLNRIALGLALDGKPDWLGWQERLRQDFPAYCVGWHRLEALRQRTAARLLATTAPLVSAQRYCDAGLSALNAVAAEAGEFYVGVKWLGLKLDRLGRDDLVAAHTALLDTPIHLDEVPDYRDRAETLLADLTGDWRQPAHPTVVLSAGPGYDVWSVQGRALAHRWGLRGVELDEPVHLPWRGSADRLDESLRDLVEHNLVWLSVAGGPA